MKIRSIKAADNLVENVEKYQFKDKEKIKLKVRKLTDKLMNKQITGEVFEQEI